MRFALLLFLFTHAAIAQPVSVAPWMTGQRLVELAAWPANARDNIDLTPRQRMDQELVAMFVVGVHDATEGKGWCYSQTAKPKPGTLHELAIDKLRALPSEQLKRAAADLIVETWRAKYPCPAERKNP
jgi:hypothetical protein